MFRAIAALLTTAVAISGCAFPPAPTDGTVSSSAEVAAPLALAARLDAAIDQAMTDASIPGAIVGIWSPTGEQPPFTFIGSLKK